jgi:mono/diheme cytochrome c family protein
MISMEKWMLSFVEEPKEEAPAPAPAPVAAEKLVFADLIQPIFAAKCNSCHGEEKQKGELRLDTYEFTMQGGENSGDKNIVPGKPTESVSMQFILLPEDDDDHMPPEGKDQLTKEESALIQWWIEQGASNTQKVDLAALPAELKATAEALLK